MKVRNFQITLSAAIVVIVAIWLYRLSTTPSISLASQSGWSPSGPQARLPCVKVWVSSHEVVAEVARGPAELATGMMFRTNMAPNDAMLFLLPVAQQAKFYMRNTLVPLACAYMDDEGVILETHDMKPKDETLIPSGSANVRFVLEVNRGWFETNHVNPGVLVRTDKGPLSDLLRTSN